MKKTIIILAAMTALASCEVCKDCTCKTYQNPNVILSETTTEVCGKKEIDEIEGTTKTQMQGVNGFIFTECKCK